MVRELSSFRDAPQRGRRGCVPVDRNVASMVASAVPRAVGEGSRGRIAASTCKSPFAKSIRKCPRTSMSGTYDNLQAACSM